MNPLDAPMTVAVIIPTFNYARFVGDAVSSVLAQTRPADEIIVVDDGSSDDPARILAHFPTVRLIRQENRGLSAARNTGLRCCTASHVVFLDADDRLLTIALETGLEHAAKRADCALVYGGFYAISEDGKRFGRDPDFFPDRESPVRQGGYLDLLRGINVVGFPAAALHRRDCLIEESGFDETLRACEDYDLYLRLARRYGIASYPAIVAEYRRHEQNMSNDYRMMYQVGLAVLKRHETRIVLNASERAALRKGKATLRHRYALKTIREARQRWSNGKTHARWGSLAAIGLLAQAAWTSPRILRSELPASAMREIRRWRGS
jgi:glycosyltransferase involved in cell wall biosynthesis